jgi:uncharacterized protein (TIGR04222 family)
MPGNPELWRRLEQYDPDGPGGPPGRFVARLARENGWTAAYARRVADEYRRFGYLCCVAGHMVVPCEQVDQAWHLHLLDTKEYWGHFCREILGQPLHHRPSKGGVEDRRRHLECYEQTLHSYQREFGTAPPRDIWPPSAQRFGRDLRRRRVALAEHWVIPKRPIRGIASVVGIALTIALIGAAPLYSGSSNPLHWDGPTFLKLYLLLFAVALAGSFLLRYRLYNPADSGRGAFASGTGKDLDPYEMATLRQNTHLAVNAAIAALSRDHAVAVSERKTGRLLKKTRYSISAGAALPRDALPLERAVYQEVSRHRDGVEPADLHQRVQPAADAIVASLQSRGLLLGPANAQRRLLAALPLLALGAFGIVKVCIGISRDRPVMWLVLLVIGTLLLAGLMFARSRRTVRGADALSSWKDRIAQRKVRGEQDVRNGHELAWLIALYGVAVLDPRAMGALRAAVASHPAQGGGGGGCGGSCGGGCGGGGGGGCGGCGGGD